MRYFFAPMPATGHVDPGFPIAQALVKRGHEVRESQIRNAVSHVINTPTYAARLLEELAGAEVLAESA